MQQVISENKITHIKGYHPLLYGFQFRKTVHTDALDLQLGILIMQEG